MANVVCWVIKTLELAASEPLIQKLLFAGNQLGYCFSALTAAPPDWLHGCHLGLAGATTWRTTSPLFLLLEVWRCLVCCGGAKWEQITILLLDSWHMNIMPLILWQYPFWQFYSSCIIIFEQGYNYYMARFGNNDAYVVSRMKCLVTGCQLIHEPVTVRSIVHKDTV